MKNTSPSLPLLGTFTLLLLSIFNSSILVKADENRSTNHILVHDTCNKISEQKLQKVCNFEIDSDPREDLKSNLTGLLIIFISHSINNFKENIVFLQRELKSGKLNNETKLMFNKCLENFERGNTDLQESLHILLTQTGIDVYGLPTINIDAYLDLCVLDFEGDPIPPVWQTRYNNSLNLLSLILSMSNIIKCNREASCIP